VRFFEFILAERKSADLYHNTMHPVEILKSGKIKAFLDTRNDHEVSKDAKPFISLTRDPRFDFHGMGDAQFVIDQSKLANTHKITPFDYGGYSDDEAYGRRLESEERVFKDIPLSYVKKIVVQSQYNVAAKDYIPLAKELGIPVVDRKGNRLDENFADGKVNYTMPNFDFEWEEANRYEQYRKIGKEEWIKLAKTGKVVDVDNRMANDIENTEAGEEYRDDHWDGLVKAKRDRFTKALSLGQIELPIIARYSDGQLELISGNTRLTGMMRELGKAKAWIYDVPDEIADLEENFADGKVKGKSRPGRVKRAGASCNGSVTDLRKRAKNASGEKAKMYHWCANMKSGRKKGK